MHEVLVNRLGGLSLPRKSVVRLTDRPDIKLLKTSQIYFLIGNRFDQTGTKSGYFALVQGPINRP